MHAVLTHDTEETRKILEHLPESGDVDEHTVRCFVGMVQTGEVTLRDFEYVGGKALAALVTGAGLVLGGAKLCK